MPDSYIQLPVDGEGKKLRATQETNLSGDLVYSKVVKVSGETVVTKISGESVIVASGLVIAEISGEVVKVSGETVSIASGVILGSGGNIVTSVSGNIISVASGTFYASGIGVYVQSGGGVLVQSGLWLASGIITAQPVATLSGQYLASGVFHASGVGIGTRQVATKISARTILVGTSGAVFPTVAGYAFDLKLVTSNVIWIGGVATVNSGVGYPIAGDPLTNIGAQYRFEGANLNLLYGKAQTVSGIISFVAYNW